MQAEVDFIKQFLRRLRKISITEVLFKKIVSF